MENQHPVEGIHSRQVLLITAFNFKSYCMLIDQLRKQKKKKQDRRWSIWY